MENKRKVNNKQKKKRWAQVLRISLYADVSHISIAMVSSIYCDCDGSNARRKKWREMCKLGDWLKTWIQRRGRENLKSSHSVNVVGTRFSLMHLPSRRIRHPTKCSYYHHAMHTSNPIGLRVVFNCFRGGMNNESTWSWHVEGHGHCDSCISQRMHSLYDEVIRRLHFCSMVFGSTACARAGWTRERAKRQKNERKTKLSRWVVSPKLNATEHSGHQWSGRCGDGRCGVGVPVSRWHINYYEESSGKFYTFSYYVGTWASGHQPFLSHKHTQIAWHGAFLFLSSSSSSSSSL